MKLGCSVLLLTSLGGLAEAAPRTASASQGTLVKDLVDPSTGRTVRRVVYRAAMPLRLPPVSDRRQTRAAARSQRIVQSPGGLPASLSDGGKLDVEGSPRTRRIGDVDVEVTVLRRYEDGHPVPISRLRDSGALLVERRAYDGVTVESTDAPGTVIPDVIPPREIAPIGAAVAAQVRRSHEARILGVAGRILSGAAAQIVRHQRAGRVAHRARATVASARDVAGGGVHDDEPIELRLDESTSLVRIAAPRMGLVFAEDLGILAEKLALAQAAKLTTVQIGSARAGTVKLDPADVETFLIALEANASIDPPTPARAGRPPPAPPTMARVRAIPVTIALRREVLTTAAMIEIDPAQPDHATITLPDRPAIVRTRAELRHALDRGRNKGVVRLRHDDGTRFTIPTPILDEVLERGTMTLVR